jgi:hypothetical protein
VKSDLSAVKSDVAGLKSNMALVKPDLSNINNSLAHTNTAIKVLATKQDVETLPTKTDIAEIVVDTVEAAKNELKAEILTLNTKVGREVQSLKRRTTNLEEHQGLENPEKH